MSDLLEGGDTATQGLRYDVQGMLAELTVNLAPIQTYTQSLTPTADTKTLARLRALKIKSLADQIAARLS